MNKIQIVVAGVALSLLFPVVVLAQDGAAPPLLGIGLGPIIAILTAAVAVLGAVANLVPAGWRTYVALASSALGTIIVGLQDLSSTGATVTTSAVLASIIAAWVGRSKAGKS